MGKTLFPEESFAHATPEKSSGSVPTVPDFLQMLTSGLPIHSCCLDTTTSADEEPCDHTFRSSQADDTTDEDSITNRTRNTPLRELELNPDR
ncbi:hypothetical protein FOZ60_009161 [Perkinsus olseni]|uniref:Uncharacterized protein n=1 Tax=Perkinsus olseni TaxID=32597 RepID=A0A7J6PDM3_PEROL|nr:hypothetical protein FOZ60_009161 [Perkinsus olseni]